MPTPTWLTQRLAEHHRKQPKIIEFVEIIEKLWAKYFEPFLEKMLAQRSLFTMDVERLQEKIEQLDYFFPETMSENQKRIFVNWLLQENATKGSRFSLAPALARENVIGGIRWQNLYWHTGQEYGDRFYLEEEVEQMTENDQNQCTMVSRGIITISDDELALLGYTGFESRRDFEEYVLINVMRALPLRIAYQGLLYELNPHATVYSFSSTIAYNAQVGHGHVLYQKNGECSVYSSSSTIAYNAEVGHGYA